MIRKIFVKLGLGSATAIGGSFVTWLFVVPLWLLEIVLIDEFGLGAGLILPITIGVLWFVTGFLGVLELGDTKGIYRD